MDTKIEEYKQLMSHWPTGVAIITTRNANGNLFGFTANSFSSVSLQPLLISFYLKCNSYSLSAFRSSKKVAINILNSQQQDLAMQFSHPSSEKFRNVNYYFYNNNCPIIDPCLASIECTIIIENLLGDHYCFVCAVETMKLNSNQSPLLYHNRRFLNLEQLTASKL